MKKQYLEHPLVTRAKQISQRTCSPAQTLGDDFQPSKGSILLLRKISLDHRDKNSKL